MLLNDVFERFSLFRTARFGHGPGPSENTLSPRFLDDSFANAAELLVHWRTLLFSSVVDLMGLWWSTAFSPPSTPPITPVPRPLACRSRPVYNKLDNLETGISAAMVGTTAERLETVVTTMGGAPPPTVAGLSHRDS